MKAKMNKIREILLIPRIRYSNFFQNITKSFSYNGREDIINKAMEFVGNSYVKGDYLEFGVYIGKTFVPAYYLAQKHLHKNMKFYAFDSFEGFPCVEENEYDWKEGDYSCSVSNFKKILINNKVNLKKVHIITGWFNKVLNNKTKEKIPLKKASVIYIDCDLYKSTVPVLNFITDYLQNGTILIFDDWFCFKGNPNKGEQKAFREWLKKNPKIEATEYYKFGWHGNSFIITIKNAKITQKLKGRNKQ